MIEDLDVLIGRTDLRDSCRHRIVIDIVREEGVPAIVWFIGEALSAIFGLRRILIHGVGCFAKSVFRFL